MTDPSWLPALGLRPPIATSACLTYIPIPIPISVPCVCTFIPCIPIPCASYSRGHQWPIRPFSQLPSLLPAFPCKTWLTRSQGDGEEMLAAKGTDTAFSIPGHR